MARTANWLDVSGQENVQAHLHGPGFFRPSLTPEGVIKRLAHQTRDQLPERTLDANRPYTP